MASVYRRKYWVTTKDGRREQREQKHYTYDVRDPATGKVLHFKGRRDKKATEQLAAAKERELARNEVGLVDEFKAHRGVPIRQHVKDYLADLRASALDEKYVGNVDKRLAIMLKGCGWSVLGDVTAASFVRWRESKRSAPRNGTRKDMVDKGASAATLNQYLDTAKAFMNWCATMGRVRGVPIQRRGRNDRPYKMSEALAAVGKVAGERRRNRRALTDEQVSALLAVAPDERAIVYRMGLSVGLRRDELRQLQWGDLGLRSTRPYIQLRAEATKARRGDRVYLPQSLADELRKRKPDGAGDADAVFPVVPSLKWWQHDLKAAGIPYRDENGRQADFHAGTRKTLCTRLHRGNVPLASAMRIMRHTTAKLTLVDYTDDDQVVAPEHVLPELTAAVPPTPPAEGATAVAAG